MVQGIYLGCAILALSLIATLVGVHLAMPLAGAASLNAPARMLINIVAVDCNVVLLV
jgi:hypothetical protein